MPPPSSRCTLELEFGHISKQVAEPDPDDPERHTHKWSVFVQGINGAPIDHIVEKVTFTLHESFRQNVRIVSRSPFSVSESGYAGFIIPVTVSLKYIKREIVFNYDMNLKYVPVSEQKVVHTVEISDASPEFVASLSKAGTAIDSDRPKKTGTQQRTTSPSEVFSELFGEAIHIDSKKRVLQTQQPSTSLPPSSRPVSAEKSSSKDRYVDKGHQHPRVSTSASSAVVSNGNHSSMHNTPHASASFARMKELHHNGHPTTSAAATACSLHLSKQQDSISSATSGNSSSPVKQLSSPLSLGTASVSRNNSTRPDAVNASSKLDAPRLHAKSATKSASDSKQKDYHSSSEKESIKNAHEHKSSRKEKSSSHATVGSALHFVPSSSSLFTTDDSSDICDDHYQKSRFKRKEESLSPSSSASPDAIIAEGKRVRHRSSTVANKKSKVSEKNGPPQSVVAATSRSSKQSVSFGDSGFESDSSCRPPDEKFLIKTGDLSGIKEKPVEVASIVAYNDLDEKVVISTSPVLLPGITVSAAQFISVKDEPSENPRSSQEMVMVTPVKCSVTQLTAAANAASKVTVELEDQSYLAKIVKLQQRIMSVRDRKTAQHIADIVGETGRFEVSGLFLDFDLCKLDKDTVEKLDLCLSN